MAGSFEVRRLTGQNASITSTNVTSGSVHAGTQDTNTSPCRIPVPTSGSNYSFWVTLQLNATASPDNSYNNIKFYTDAGNSFGTGITAIVAAASGYASAVGAAGSSGSLLSNANHGAFFGTATSNLFLYTSSCKLSLSGSIGTTTGSFGDRVVLQLSVDSTAAAGNTVGEVLTFETDES